MTYTCWQCKKDFERTANEWFCKKCQKRRKKVVIAKPIFKGRGFYSTETK